MLDAGFLQAEDSDRHVSLAIGAIAVLAGPMPDFDTLAVGLAERILSVPGSGKSCAPNRSISALRGGSTTPTSTSSITCGARRCRVPATTRRCSGGSPRSWNGASIATVRCGKCWIVDGLQHNRWAILMKVHHCIADGIAATHMLARLCDDGGGGTFATAIRAAHEPVRGGLRLPALTLNPIDWIAGAWRTSLGVTTAAAHALQGAAEIAGGLLRPAAASSLTGPVTTMRRYATAEVSLDDVATGVRSVRGDHQRCRIGGDHRQLPHNADASR